MKTPTATVSIAPYVDTLPHTPTLPPTLEGADIAPLTGCLTPQDPYKGVGPVTPERPKRAVVAAVVKIESMQTQDTYKGVSPLLDVLDAIDTPSSPRRIRPTAIPHQLPVAFAVPIPVPLERQCGACPLVAGTQSVDVNALILAGVAGVGIGWLLSSAFSSPCVNCITELAECELPIT